VSAWVTIPCLLKLRDEFNEVSPNRDKGADGTIGDSNHTSTSDHTPDEDSDVLRGKDADSTNEVHALDIDSTGPWPWSFDSKIKQLIAEEKRRWLDPNDMSRLRYIIWDHTIYHQDNDWAGRPYTGSDPHTNHGHFSGRYETRAENDTRPWGVAEDEMTKDEFMTWMKEFHAKTNEGFATWMANGLGGADTAYNVLQGAHGKTKLIKDDTAVLRADSAKILAALADLAGKDFTDENAIIQGVLAGLAAADGAAETIANAVVAALPADLAAETARLILTKGGQAMVDAGQEIE
jgi:hypothetical protein